jgi:DNA-binding response OmpR family regulator
MVIPKNEGLSVLNEIMTAGIPTRIVLTSDFGEQEAERIAGSHGAERPLILKKPFRRNELVELLKNILDG